MAYSPWSEEAFSYHTSSSYTCPLERLFDNTLDIGYAYNIGLSQAIHLTNIHSDNSMAAASNSMPLNGEKSVELRICFSRNPPQPAPLWEHEVPVLTTTKYLGFHMDSDLSGGTHIR